MGENSCLPASKMIHGHYNTSLSQEGVTFRAEKFSARGLRKFRRPPLQPLAHLSDDFHLLLLNLLGFLNLPVTFRSLEIMHCLSKPSLVAAVGLPGCLFAGLSGFAHCGVSCSAGVVVKSNKISSVGVNSKKIPKTAAITLKIPSCQLIC
ncbi:hypothetical protein KW637_004827 [Escherichia coli]|nr:hypothetical protein [Escherichia coli]